MRRGKTEQSFLCLTEILNNTEFESMDLQLLYCSFNFELLEKQPHLLCHFKNSLTCHSVQSLGKTRQSMTYRCLQKGVHFAKKTDRPRFFGALAVWRISYSPLCRREAPPRAEAIARVGQASDRWWQAPERKSNRSHPDVRLVEALLSLCCDLPLCT